jgi:flagellar biosynthesis protein FlhA
VLLVLSLVPGLPKVSFILLAAGAAILARSVGKGETTEEGLSVATPGHAPGGPPPDAAEAVSRLDEISLEVGYGLVAMVDEAQGGQLLRRIRALRKHLATQLGFLVPPIHITDNLRLRPREYVVQLRGVEIARWELQGESLLAISSESDAPAIEGVPTNEPAFGVGAKWIIPERREQALAAGYAVVDQTSVIATHLAELIRRHSGELLTRSETKRLLDSLSESHPKVAEELGPKILSLGEVHKVLQQLLREQVSVRDLVTILETLIEAAPINKNLVQLVESVRQALGRALVHPLLAEDGKLLLITLDPTIEEEITRATSGAAPTNRNFGLQTSFLRRVLDGLRRLVGDPVANASPVLLCSSPARFHLRRQLEPFLPKVVVLSPGEIPPTVPVQSLGMVS